MSSDLIIVSDPMLDPLMVDDTVLPDTVDEDKVVAPAVAEKVAGESKKRKAEEKEEEEEEGNEQEEEEENEDGYTAAEVAAGVWIVSMLCAGQTTMLAVCKTEAEAEAWAALHATDGSNTSSYPKEEFKCASLYKKFFQMQDAGESMMSVRRPDGSYNIAHPGHKIFNRAEEKGRFDWEATRDARRAESGRMMADMNKQQQQAKKKQRTGEPESAAVIKIE